MTILAPREIQILKGFAEGKSVKQIAFQNKICERTVHCYTAKSRLKLRVHTTIQAVAVACWTGLITPEDKQEPAKIAD